MMMTDLAKKRHGSADLYTPIHPPPVGSMTSRFSGKEPALLSRTQESGGNRAYSTASPYKSL